MLSNRPVLSEQNPARFLILPLWIVAAYATGLLMVEGAILLLWIVCAFFLFVLLDPMAEYLKARKWPTALAAAFLVLAAALISTVLTSLLGYMASGLIAELEQSRALFVKAYESLMQSLNFWFAKVPGLQSGASAVPEGVSQVELVHSTPLSGEWSGRILHGLGSAVTIMTFAILVPILGFFLLAERDLFARILRMSFRDQNVAGKVWRSIVMATRAFFFGNLVLAAITFPVFILIFWLFNVPSVFTVAVLATVFNLIPFAGAVLAGLLPAIALYTQTETYGAALTVYGICLAIHFVVADVVTPKILGSQVNINATTSTIALIAWGELWGGVGLILAIPLTSVIKILLEHSGYFWLQWIAALMSEKVDFALDHPATGKIDTDKETSLEPDSAPAGSAN